ncbi:MAG: OPT family oligopeptide transporter [Planctomycetota bacterium]
MTDENAPQERTSLPENARKPLKPGEEYIPMIPAESKMLEVTPRSVIMGLIFCAIFAMAAAYLALKIGQGIEAAIPISILAIGIGNVLARKSTILENVIVQSIGANSSHVVAGAVFTIPALYMLYQEGVIDQAPAWYQVILTAFLGGCLGILFLIPLRHYFMIQQHGMLPWPEATATTEILVSGQKVGNQAKVLAISAAIGIVYDGLVTTFHAWKEIISFESVKLGVFLKDQFMTIRILNASAVIGIGYIVGLRYAAVICAGSFLSWFVLVPIVHAIGDALGTILPPGGVLISEMTRDEVFTNYVKIIGVGGIAGAGIMGIIRAFPSMIGSMRKGLGGLGSGAGTKAVKRTDRSLTGKFTVTGIVIFLVAVFLFFSFGLGLEESFLYALVGTLLCGVIAFLFAPVSARAIAIVGTNPVSGMTMLTIIVTGVVMLSLGLSGSMGMFVVMLIGGVVCTALCASGALSSDLKIGQWIGATPRNQLLLKFVGTFVAAAFCGLAMWIMSEQPQGMGFGTSNLPAPQATAMKEILVGIMGTEAAPLRWYLFALGVLLSLILQMCQVPALAFALGMYLPIQLNVPVLIGGFLAWMVGRKREAEPEEKTKAGHNRGILIASGLMAGGALMGIFDGIINAILKFAAGGETPEEIKTNFDHMKEKIHFMTEETLEGFNGEVLGIVMLFLLCFFIVWYARKGKEDIGGPDLD